MNQGKYDPPLRELQNREVIDTQRRSVGKSESNAQRNQAGQTKKPQQTEFLNKFKDVVHFCI